MTTNNPFIKVTWQDAPENFTPEKIRRVKSYFQEKYNTKNIQVITKSLSHVKNTKLKSLEASDNILDPQHQKTLMKEFIKENNIDIDWSLVDRLDNRVNSQIDKHNQNKVRYNKWYIKKIEFSNFLSFGENNEINFETLNGITVIESSPRNFGGKSTATVDLLMFLFFNSTTKTKTNAEIFNKFTDKDELTVKGYITIDGEDYIIERKTNRKKSKSGEYTVTNKLEFFKKKADGQIENLTGEQRRETEDFISSAIGTEEDFLSTILTTGYNLEELIESKPTARGQILTKFIGLESLKQKEEICKEIYNDWSKKLVSNHYDISQLETDNNKYADSSSQSEKEIEILDNKLSELQSNLSKIENKKEDLLSKRNNDIDQDLIKINPDSLNIDIDELTKKRNLAKSYADSVDVKEPSKYYLEEEHDKVRTKLNDLTAEKTLLQKSIVNQEKLIKQLEEGSVCPTCNRKLDEVDHTDEINKIKNELVNFKSKQEKLKSKIEEQQKKEEGFSILKTEYDTYEKNKLKKARYELEVEQKDVEINAKKLKLDNYENNKKKLDDNRKIDAELVGVKSQLETINADIRIANLNIERHKNNILNMKDKITVNIDLMKKIKAESETMAVFKVYLTIYGKNGIAKVILKNMIPLINLELYRLLVDSCHFILELNINDKNEVEFVMIDTETRVVKSLSSGSGYERTISSLALRSVLTKISSLPKPNIVVMDEVFGKVADDNLEMVGEFFKKIKNYFEHIFVISHNPLIRNWSDNLIMIKKEDNVSSIDFITTKIS